MQRVTFIRTLTTMIISMSTGTIMKNMITLKIIPTKVASMDIIMPTRKKVPMRDLIIMKAQMIPHRLLKNMKFIIMINTLILSSMNMLMRMLNTKIIMKNIMLKPQIIMIIMKNRTNTMMIIMKKKFINIITIRLLITMMSN
jgi:hypothetical protein